MNVTKRSASQDQCAGEAHMKSEAPRPVAANAIGDILLAVHLDPLKRHSPEATC